MKRKAFADWCETATKKIRYGPDREAVSRELMDHLEDRYEALVARGVSPKDAACQTLEAMGSAQAIAPQLAAIHRPVLGWIYSTVRFIGILMVVYAVAASLFAGYHYLYSLANTYDSREEGGISRAKSSFEEIACHVEPNLRAYVDGHQMHLSEAAVVYSNQETLEYRCLIELKVTNWPWNYGFSAMDYFWATDSLGNYYASNQEYTESAPGIEYVSGGYHSSGISYSVFEIKGFDPDAQWVELCYTRDGRNLVFHIDFPGGEEK